MNEPTAKPRDPRLDFFRGVGMFIILIAHIPWNNWTGWIPARFGHSDATEIFVFCSGAASAIAFLKVFETRGWWVGTARIAFRIWQIYWCHIAIFLTTLAALIVLDATLSAPRRVYVETLGMAPFLEAPSAFLAGLFTLRYVPNTFDILAMYIVILALLPVIALVARLGTSCALGLSVILWLAANQPWLAVFDVPRLSVLDLPANPADPARTWFFNPFAWQLIFFTGFALSAGWIRKPPVRPLWISLALAMLVASFLMDRSGGAAGTPPTPVEGLLPLFEPGAAASAPVNPLASKTDLGILRYLHFLALAYLAWALAGEDGRRLPGAGAAGAVVTVVRRVGQQSLAVFIASLLITQLLGVLIAENSILGPGEPIHTPQWIINAANLTGFALLVLVAYGARFFRAQPWIKKSSSRYPA